MARLRDYASLLDTYLKHLELVLRSVEDPRVFEERIEVMYSTMHILQLAIQALLDMSLRLIAYIGARRPETYAEVADVLYANGILSEEERDLLRRMARFRNLLVHVYARIDPAVVFTIAKERAKSDIERIARRILEEGIRRGLDP